MLRVKMTGMTCKHCIGVADLHLNSICAEHLGEQLRIAGLDFVRGASERRSGLTNAP
jgi:hypothetical protein